MGLAQPHSNSQAWIYGVRLITSLVVFMLSFSLPNVFVVIFFNPIPNMTIANNAITRASAFNEFIFTSSLSVEEFTSIF